MVSHSVVFLLGERVLCRRDAQVFQPLRVNIESPGAVLHDFAVPVLTLTTQKPVDKNLGSVGVGRIFDDAEYAGAVACRQSLFRRGRWFDRQSRLDKRFGLTST